MLEDLVLCLLSETALSREIATKTIILNQACISASPGKVKYTCWCSTRVIMIHQVCDGMQSVYFNKALWEMLICVLS